MTEYHLNPKTKHFVLSCVNIKLTKKIKNKICTKLYWDFLINENNFNKTEVNLSSLMFCYVRDIADLNTHMHLQFILRCN